MKAFVTLFILFTFQQTLYAESLILGNTLQCVQDGFEDYASYAQQDLPPIPDRWIYMLGTAVKEYGGVNPENILNGDRTRFQQKVIEMVQSFGYCTPIAEYSYVGTRANDISPEFIAFIRSGKKLSQKSELFQEKFLTQMGMYIPHWGYLDEFEKLFKDVLKNWDQKSPIQRQSEFSKATEKMSGKHSESFQECLRRIRENVVPYGDPFNFNGNTMDSERKKAIKKRNETLCKFMARRCGLQNQFCSHEKPVAPPTQFRTSPYTEPRGGVF